MYNFEPKDLVVTGQANGRTNGFLKATRQSACHLNNCFTYAEVFPHRHSIWLSCENQAIAMSNAICDMGYVCRRMGPWRTDAAFWLYRMSICLNAASVLPNQCVSHSYMDKPRSHTLLNETNMCSNVKQIPILILVWTRRRHSKAWSYLTLIQSICVWSVVRPYVEVMTCVHVFAWHSDILFTDAFDFLPWDPIHHVHVIRSIKRVHIFDQALLAESRTHIYCMNSDACKDCSTGAETNADLKQSWISRYHGDCCCDSYFHSLFEDDSPTSMAFDTLVTEARTTQTGTWTRVSTRCHTN